MRPLKLKMIAFGPYKNEETIDFTVLGNRRLFVISGNTGAGKTTIFDAICFALYGSASGEDRHDVRMLRSHFADEDVHTSVELEFAVGARLYRVFRQLPHRKKGNKGETGDKIELYELIDGLMVPCVDRFMLSEVNAKLQRILGITKEQFSQIVMLPQGEFRKLLTSETENKEEILRRIFRTELYQKVEARFQGQSREWKETLQKVMTEQEVYVSQAEKGLPVRESSSLAQVWSQPVRSVSQVLDALEQESAYYAGQLKGAQGQREQLAERVVDAEASWQAASRLNERFEQLAEQRRKLDALEQRAPEAAAHRERLRAAEQASRLAPYAEQRSTATAHAAAVAVRHGALRSAAAATATAHAAAEQRHRTEAARAEARQAADREVARLVALAPAVAQLAARQHAVAQLATATAGAAGRRDALERELAEARAARQHAGERAQALERAAVALPERERELERRRAELRLVRELRELERAAAVLAQRERAQAAALATATAELAQLEALWLEGQAAQLAEHLYDGQPCPVCGGTEHPAKASASSTLPGKEELQSLKERVRSIEQELSDTKARFSTTMETSITKREEDKQYLSNREDLTANENDEQRETRLTTEGIRLKEEADLLKQQVAELEPIREQLVQCEVTLERLLSEKDKLTSSYQELLVQFTEKQSELNTDLARIPEEERSPKQVEQRLVSQQQLADELNTAWNFAQEQLTSLMTQLGKDQAALTECNRQLTEANQHSNQVAERFTQQLTDAGFASLDAYQAAQLSGEAYQTLQVECDSYDASRAALAKLVADLELELTGQSLADLELITNQLVDAKAHLEQANDALRFAEGRLQEVERISQSLQSLQARSRQLDSQLSQLLDVYQTLKGDNPLKMSFERYILIEFLEHILQAANARLRRMSGGQFVLERSERLEGKGRQSGLGLDVYDAYTGQTRDVKTLSGGEKFNASLCLALGMTDVIQSYQGGVSIEMMFIDEGFGTLDEDSLNQAIETLVDLQRAGRMIGVISHVQELKNAFPAVLEVNKSKEGYSSTTFLLK